MVSSQANPLNASASNLETKQEAIWLRIRLLLFHLLCLNLHKLLYLLRLCDIAEIVRYADRDFFDDRAVFSMLEKVTHLIDVAE